MDTSGFYKLDEDVLLFAPTEVLSADFSLHRDFHEQLSEAGGWRWFNAKEEATEFFNLKADINGNSN